MSEAQENNLNAENQQSRFRRYACVATSVGGLVAGAGAYAWASGVNNNNYDQADTYQVNPFNGLVGAGAAVGAAAVSWLVAKGVQAYCCVRDRTVAIVRPPEEQDFANRPGARPLIGIEMPGREEYESKLQQLEREGQPGAGQPSSSAGEGVSAVKIHPSGKPA